MQTLSSSPRLELGLLTRVPTAAGATFVELPLWKLAAGADELVLARVIELEAHVFETEEGLVATTLIGLAVERWIEGSGPAHLHLWEEVGRRSREHGETRPSEAEGEVVSSSAPKYQLGERVLAFLERDQEHRRTYKRAQGKFSVHTSPLGLKVARDLSEFLVVGFERGSAVLRPGGKMVQSLEDVLAVVERTRGWMADA